jgi:hypothetical protein
VSVSENGLCNQIELPLDQILNYLLLSLFLSPLLFSLTFLPFLLYLLDHMVFSPLTLQLIRESLINYYHYPLTYKSQFLLFQSKDDEVTERCLVSYVYPIERARILHSLHYSLQIVVHTHPNLQLHLFLHLFPLLFHLLCLFIHSLYKKRN